MKTTIPYTEFQNTQAKALNLLVHKHFSHDAGQRISFAKFVTADGKQVQAQMDWPRSVQGTPGAQQCQSLEAGLFETALNDLTLGYLQDAGYANGAMLDMDS